MRNKKEKKLIQHLLFSGLGGHGSVFFSLIDADKEKQYEYRALFCGIEELRKDYIENCNKRYTPFEYVKKKRGLDIKVYFKLFRSFYKYKPDIIFIHGVSLMMPAVWYKITRPSAKILIRDSQAHHLKSKQEWFWLFFSLLFAQKVIVLTDASASGIRQKFRWFSRPNKLVIIPNGLDISRYKPSFLKQSGTSLRIGMQSRLQPIKDHPTLLKAFKILQQKLPGYSFSLHIAGDGETMPVVRTMVDELQLGESVHLHGMLGEGELISFMQSLDIYVHATFGETLSNSIIQAMASGLPIIASDVWGVNNMITHEENGMLYTEKREDILANQLEDLVLSPDKRNRLGCKALLFAEQNYSNMVMFNRYKELYN
jgi:L-malate glycosyltransferase